MLCKYRMRYFSMFAHCLWILFDPYMCPYLYSWIPYAVIQTSENCFCSSLLLKIQIWWKFYFVLLQLLTVITTKFHTWQQNKFLVNLQMPAKLVKLPLNNLMFIHTFLQGTNEQRNLTNEQMLCVVHNLSTYMDYVALETSSASWQTILMQFDLFFRRLPTLLPNECDMTPVLKIMIAVLKIPGLTSIKVRQVMDLVCMQYFAHGIGSVIIVVSLFVDYW